ncbi:uncharacterized protein N7482_004113 [Penicillium canariense]|uniref:Tyrosinase copper-binding domain-containing protein n=1 Tax=Penicillium canariense TaxID=189055 RepID=A0A9W9LP25_9EURO|nr:uncharacterized protein N7482_004113 [Penicillium canariense]KAJ5168519.1 hypothetical protein N7482_004113 [Penicillium canariense]
MVAIGRIELTSRADLDKIGFRLRACTEAVMIALSVFTWGLLALQTWAIPTASSDRALAQSPSLSIPAVASSSTAKASAQLEQLAQIALGVATDNLSKSTGACTTKNVLVRRDWRAFASPEKKAYISAVRCLQKLPSRTPSTLVPGARTRYDDFVATHINQTLEIHYTGTFLAWHRYFVYEFEQALRQECGYTGHYPYWDWGADAAVMEKSEVFDGSDTSMSGNGVYIPNQPDIVLTLGNYAPVYLPAGTGGGCVTSGPFKDYQVNLGPAALMLPGGNVSAATNPFNYNPRCLKRDLTSAILQRYANYTSIVSLIINNDNIWDFEMAMQGVPGSGAIGVHGGGHYSMGGDPGRDVFVSPGDPAFWHHHGMIDRVWWIWQNLDLKTRQDAISGTGTFLNEPVSANTTLDTVIDIGYANGSPIAMRDLMKGMDGMCMPPPLSRVATGVPLSWQDHSIRPESSSADAKVATYDQNIFNYLQHGLEATLGNEYENIDTRKIDCLSIRFKLLADHLITSRVLIHNEDANPNGSPSAGHPTRADCGQTGDRNKWPQVEGEGITGPAQYTGISGKPMPLHEDGKSEWHRSKRIAIIGGGIGGISVAHFLKNDENRLNLSQLTIFEKEAQFGGRIRFAQVYGHGTNVNTAGHTFDADDPVIEEIANFTSIKLHDWPYNGWNTATPNFLYWASRFDGENIVNSPADEPFETTWTDLATHIRQTGADPHFWISYVRYVWISLTETHSVSWFKFWVRQMAGSRQHFNCLLWAGSRATAGHSIELMSRIADSNPRSVRKQKDLSWNQHDRILTGLLGDLRDHEEFSTHLNSTVKQVKRYDNGTFGVIWTQRSFHGSQETYIEQFDNVIIATPLHQAELEIEPPLPLEPEEITYTPLHATNFISKNLPATTLFRSHGERWSTLTALLWNDGSQRVGGSAAPGLAFISIAHDEHVCCGGFYLNQRVGLARVISRDRFSDGDIAALFGEARKNVTFPEQTCWVPQQASPDSVQPRYQIVREGFALEDGSVNQTTGCVEKPTITWIHRDYWPNGMPEIKRDGQRVDDSVWMELAPGMFYVNGFEGREGASVSKSVARGRKVKDMLVARYTAEPF